MNIGIDIISIKKFKRMTTSDFRHWRKVFTSREWQYAFSGGNKFAERLAGMFAAKEAAMKAFGKTGAQHFLAFEIMHLPSGAPKLNKLHAQMSIAHNQDTAIAVVVRI